MNVPQGTFGGGGQNYETLSNKIMDGNRPYFPNDLSSREPERCGITVREHFMLEIAKAIIQANPATSSHAVVFNTERIVEQLLSKTNV